MKQFIERETRIRTFLAGRVRAGRLRAENCVVENLSSGGALLKLQTNLSLPEVFSLDVLKWRETYRVRLVWRDALSAGVEFSERLEWRACMEHAGDIVESAPFLRRPTLGLLSE